MLAGKGGVHDRRKPVPVVHTTYMSCALQEEAQGTRENRHARQTLSLRSVFRVRGRIETILVTFFVGVRGVSA